MRPRERGTRLHPPRLSVIVLLIAAALAISGGLYPQAWTLDEFRLGAYLSVVWTLPTGLSVMAILGAVLARRSLVDPAGRPDGIHTDGLLVVQVPTIARHDVMPALRRVVASMEESLPGSFAHWRVDVVAEQSSEAREELEALRGHRLSLQRHDHRGELWQVLDVPIDITLGDREWTAARGETVWVPRGALHRMGNSGRFPGRVLEVAFGHFDEDDIERVDDDYSR